MKKNILKKDNSLLIVIDIQEAFRDIMEKYDFVVKRADILMKSAKIMNISTILTEQYPKGLGKTATELLDNSYRLFEKTKFSIFTKEIKKEIKKSKKKNIIIAGMESHVCVLQSTRDLLNNGYNVFIAEDALCSRRKFNHKNAIRQMDKWGANISNTESILFDMLVNSKDEDFKDISKMVKEL